MKTLLNLIAAVLLSVTAFAQGSAYGNGYDPLTTPTNLQSAKTISDISPLLWRMMGLSAKDRFALDFLRKQDSATGYYLQPPVNNYPNIVNVVFAELTIVSKGKKISVHHTGETLTAAQKYLLSTADMSSNIELKVLFLFKNYTGDSEIKEGKIAVTIVPETEAVYPGGGAKDLSKYLQTYVKHRHPSGSPVAIQNASVLFTVTEDGSLADISLKQLSGDSRTDKLLLEAVKQMPKWKPAFNAKGAPVKQTIHITFGGC
jgi:TonB family protein